MNTSDSNIFVTPHTEFKTYIKHTDEYTCLELINKCEELETDNLEKSLTHFMRFLNSVANDSNELSDKLLNSIKRSVNKQSSRITYKFNNSKNHLSITVNRCWLVDTKGFWYFYGIQGFIEYNEKIFCNYW